MKNGEIKEVVIDGITNEGNGVGRVDSMAVFVPESAVGDRLRVRIEKVGKSFAVGKAVKILDASPARITPDCPCFSECGGCAFRHISYGEELKIKRRFVEDAFTRIGKINHPVENVLSGNVDGYRN